MPDHPEETPSRKADEQAIQRFIAKLARGNTLLSAIRGKEAVRKAAAARRGPDIIPTLSIDSLQRERIILAADEALNALADIEIISDNTSISRNTGEILRPDFVLFNRELGRLVLVELKDDKLPERQAVTELLAYERELRNHFPFMGGMEVVFVLVAREWGDLLNHAYAALAMRGRPSLLALTVSGEKPDLQLEVRTEEAWSRHFQLNIAASALHSRTYRVRFADHNPERAWLALNEAAHLMRQAADRAGQHGFSCLWEEASDPGVLGLTLYTVDPAHLHIPVDPINPARDSPFTEFFSNFFATHSMRYEPGLEAVLSPLRQTLRNSATIEHVRDGTWSDDLAWIKAQGAVILGYQYWGLISDFAVRIGTSEAARQHFMLDRSGGVEMPLAGLQIITAMTGTQPFAGGRIGVRSLYELGKLLKQALELARGRTQDVAGWTWLNSELAVYSAELAYLVRSWVEPCTLMEPLHLFAEPDVETAANLEQYIDWLRRELHGSPLSVILKAGMRAASVETAAQGLDPQIYQQVCMDLCTAINLHVGSDEQWATAIGSLPTELRSCRNAWALYQKVCSNGDVGRRLPLLLEMAEAWIPALRRRQRFIDDVAFDIQELRQGIRDLLSNLPVGKLPCILVGADGMVGSSVINIPPGAAPIDHTTQVAVLNRSSGRDLVTILDWDELSDGTLSALRTNIVGRPIDLEEWSHGSASPSIKIGNNWARGKIDFAALGLCHPGAPGAKFLELSLSEESAPEIAIVINTAIPVVEIDEPQYFVTGGVFIHEAAIIGFMIVDAWLGDRIEKHALIFDIDSKNSLEAISQLNAQTVVHFVHCDLSGNVLAFHEVTNTFDFAKIEESVSLMRPNFHHDGARELLHRDRDAVIDALLRELAGNG